MLLLLGVFVSVLFLWGSNPVYSILTLITTSLTCGLLLLQQGLEFLPFVLVLIYVGAVAVLFLFVVMMINFKLITTNLYLPENFLFWLLTSLNLASQPSFITLSSGCQPAAVYFFNYCTTSNFTSFSLYLYQTPNIVVLIVVGLVLLVAMLGAISLTYITSSNYRSQHIPSQTRRSSSLYRLEKQF